MTRRADSIRTRHAADPTRSQGTQARPGRMVRLPLQELVPGLPPERQQLNEAGARRYGLVTVPQIARAAGVAPGTVRQWVPTPGYPSIRICTSTHFPDPVAALAGSHEWLYPADQVTVWLDARKAHRGR